MCITTTITSIHVTGFQTRYKNYRPQYTRNIMIQYRVGNPIKSVTEGILAHGCNAQGVMGSGFAKELRAKYPEVFDDYVKHLNYHKKKQISPLGTCVYTIPYGEPDLLLASGITQEYYGRDGSRYVDYDAMSKVFIDLNDIAKRYLYHEVHMPKIGAGLGGGDWEIISDLIEARIQNVPVYVWELK